MVVTDDVILPTEEELTVQEINLSYPILQAASMYMGKYCEWKNNEFMLCRYELQDPRKCLNEGKAVTACALEFFRKIKKSCHDEFNQYSQCIDKASGLAYFAPCRNTQAVFDKCVLEKLNIERPYYGYFAEAKVHDSPRPPPKREEPVFEGRPTPIPPRDTWEAPPRFGADTQMMT